MTPKQRFAQATANLTEAAQQLLTAWEAVEMETGETPSDVAGYPFLQSFDEQLLKIAEWNHAIQNWALPTEGK